LADLTHDLGDDGFHEIHLSGKQLVFLFMATTVVSVVIFLCGVLVGRGVQAEQSADSLTEPFAASSTSASNPPAAAGSGPAASEPPAPAAEAEELDYKRRLEGETASRERVTPEPEPPPPPSQPEPEKSSAPPARTAAPPAAEPAPATAAAVPAGVAVKPPQAGTWVLQVHALRDAKVANGIVQRLSKKGYPAYVVASGAPSNMYRVFVGRYKERDEAERVAARLKKEEQFNPWITR
jgi:cell division septation protein DedD